MYDRLKSKEKCEECGEKINKESMEFHLVFAHGKKSRRGSVNK